MKELSIVIPCYNESSSLSNLIDVCREACKKEPGVEVVFVNNGSTDNSSDVFNEHLAQSENSFARVITVPVNRGYGFGILKGLEAATGRVLAWTHADLQTDPKDVIIAFSNFKEQLLSEKCILKGRRVGRNLFDVLFTSAMSAVASILLSTRLSDINAQPKIFHRNFLLKLSAPPFDFSLDIYVLFIARREGMKIETFDVNFHKREAGEAKGGGTLKGKFRLIMRTFKFILELRKKTMRH